MQKRYIIGVLAFLALIFSWPGDLLAAEKQLKLDLKLRTPEKFAPVPISGEFKLSLDSQLFENTLIDDEISSDELLLQSRISPRLDLDSMTLNDNSRIEMFPGRMGPTRNIDEEKRFSSTLTLKADYFDLSADEAAEESLKLEKKLGKFKILGEFAQKHITRIPLPERTEAPGFSANAQTPLNRASMLNNPINEIDQQNKTSALASRYYLEAIYSFKPSVQGKLSYRRSMVDTLESEEELQFEGIVEANRNVVIKAGYNNETRPELTEPKSTKDSKVWTEFILKF